MRVAPACDIITYMSQGVLSPELADKVKWDKNGRRLILWQVWGAKLSMSQAVHDAVLAVSVWVVLNQWSIWEMIERERGKPTRKRRHEPQRSGEPRPFPGLTQKPICQACAKEEEQGKGGVEAPPMIAPGRVLLMVVAVRI